MWSNKMTAELPRFSRQQIEAYIELQHTSDKLAGCKTIDVLKYLKEMQTHANRLHKLGLSNDDMKEMRILWERGELQKQLI